MPRSPGTRFDTKYFTSLVNPLRATIKQCRRPATRQTRILFLAAPTWRRAIAQHPRLDHPAVEIGGHFPHEYLPTLFEAVQKGGVAPVGFVERPGLDAHAVAQSAVHHPQGDLRLGAEHHFVGVVTFFRRTRSSAHSWGR